jgi:hypothetical protein
MALLQSVADEDGMPLLQLAISLGCSTAIIRYLIRLGTPIGDAEIKMAAKADQPETLSVLLQSSVYHEGLVDVNVCSPAVSSVIDDASRRQETQHRTMRLEAGSFVASFLRQLLKLGLSSRHEENTTDLCSRAIAGALVGDVILDGLQERQKHASDTSRLPIQGGTQNEGVTCNSEQKGLLQALPDELLGKSLLETPGHLTSFLLLTEDYLCNKDINDSATGLTLLSTLLKRFPSFKLTSEVERYGLAELLSSHDAFASNRLAEISSRVSAREAGSAEAETLVASGVVLCPKQHAAVLHVTRHSSFRCDLCGKGVERGRVMHGCRECDWDACEGCTDNAEGGIVKWNHIRELTADCQRLLSSIDSLAGTSEKLGKGWAEKLMESLTEMDNTSDVNNLSIRVLQRDRDSVRELGSMLNSQGQLTMHQFLSVILPALHASLMGKASGNSRSTLYPTGFCRRSKKPRVVGSISRDPQNSTYSSANDDRFEFAREVLKHLIRNAEVDHGPLSSSGVSDWSGGSNVKTRLDGSDDDEEGSDDGTDSNDGKENTEHIVRKTKQKPELLRRLHMVLSLYEDVATLPKARRKSGPKGGELQSLTKPIQLCLLPLASRDGHETKMLRSNELTVHVEPLMTVGGLSRYVLRTCRVSHPSYLAFCRR